MRLTVLSPFGRATPHNTQNKIESFFIDVYSKTNYIHQFDLLENKMGSGISLGEDHMSELVKRLLEEKHQDRMNHLPPCLPQYKNWRKSIENGYHTYELKTVDICTKKIKETIHNKTFKKTE